MRINALIYINLVTNIKHDAVSVATILSVMYHEWGMR
jgi:hypothetical protein